MTHNFGPGAGAACPVCGYQGMGYGPGMGAGVIGWGPGGRMVPMGHGLGGMRTWGGTYSPQYAATGMPTDEEIAEMVYDMLDDDPLVPYDAPIEVTVEAGKVTLTGTVPNKRAKHSAGDDAWWAPGVVDVDNRIEISGRRRARGAPREQAEPGPQTQQGG